MKNKIILLVILALGIIALIEFTSAMGMYGIEYETSSYTNKNSYGMMNNQYRISYSGSMWHNSKLINGNMIRNRYGMMNPQYRTTPSRNMHYNNKMINSNMVRNRDSMIDNSIYRIS